MFDDEFEKESRKYIDNLKSNSIRSEECIINDALKQALEIRKFEIELYWKRAAHFWILIAAIFTAYYNIHDCFIKIIITIIGYIFSFSWYLVCRGSKYWQINWERHVEFLEGNQIGNLYKIVSNPNIYKWNHPLDAYPSSVSKINQLLSLIVSGLWAIIICNTFITFGIEIFWAIYITLRIVIIISALIMWKTKSSLESEEISKTFSFRIFK